MSNRQPRPRTAEHQARVVDLRRGSRTSRYSKRPDALKGSRADRRRRAVREEQ